MEAGSSKPPTGPQPPVAKPDAPTPATPATGSQDAAPQTVDQQLEGLRAWLAQLDRRLGVRSLAGALALVLALAAGIVGVVLAIGAKDESATKSEVQTLSERVSASTKEATRAAQDDLSTLSDRLDALESSVSTIASGQRTSDSELKVAQDDIDELRGQISDLKGEVDAATQAAQQAASNSGGN
jgi:uncharacterized protein HemX